MCLQTNGSVHNKSKGCGVPSRGRCCDSGAINAPVNARLTAYEEVAQLWKSEFECQVCRGSKGRGEGACDCLRLVLARKGTEEGEAVLWGCGMKRREEAWG